VLNIEPFGFFVGIAALILEGPGCIPVFVLHISIGHGGFLRVPSVVAMALVNGVFAGAAESVEMLFASVGSVIGVFRVSYEPF
jgi:hypothetical protein